MADLAAMLPIDAPIRPAHAGLRISGELYVVDRMNRRLREITDSVIGDASVTIDADADIARTLNVTLEGRDVVQAYREYLAPYLTVEWRDTTGAIQRVRRQLGLFVILPPRRDYTRNSQRNTYDGRDITYLLAQLTATERSTYGYGLDCGDVAARMLYYLSDLRLTLPKTGVLTGKTRIVRPGDPLLPHANEVLGAAGYFNLFSDHTGHIRTEQSYALSQTEPNRLISSELGDLFGPATLEPESEQFANRVALSSTAPDADRAAKDGYVIVADDLNDPWSVPNIGAYTKVIQDANDIDLDSLKVRARRILQRKSSMYARLTLSVVPDPRVTQWEAWQLDIKTDDRLTVAAPGNWRLLSTTFRFSATDGLQDVTLGKLANLSGVS